MQNVCFLLAARRQQRQRTTTRWTSANRFVNAADQSWSKCGCTGTQSVACVKISYVSSGSSIWMRSFVEQKQNQSQVSPIFHFLDSQKMTTTTTIKRKMSTCKRPYMRLWVWERKCIEMQRRLKRIKEETKQKPIISLKWFSSLRHRE